MIKRHRQILAHLGLLAVCSISAASDWERSDRGRDPVLSNYGVHYESRQESFVVSIFCAPAPYATIEIDDLKKKDSTYLKSAREANALYTVVHRGDRAPLDLPMPYRSEIAFPDLMNLDGTGDFMVDLFLHGSVGIEIPVSPEKTLNGRLNGHGLLKLLKEDAKCDVEGIDRVMEHRKGILEGEIVADENETIAVSGDDDITNPILLRKTKPDFPAVARALATEGEVILQALIGKDGSPSRVEVLRCRPPDFGFEQSSIDTIRRWRYRPGRKDGLPISVWITIRVDFTIH